MRPMPIALRSLWPIACGLALLLLGACTEPASQPTGPMPNAPAQDSASAPDSASPPSKAAVPSNAAAPANPPAPTGRPIPPPPLVPQEQQPAASADVAVPSDDAADETSEAPPQHNAKRTVVARYVSGYRQLPACGVFAFVGVYVFEIVRVEAGPPLSGRFIVDVLCPNRLHLKPGQVWHMQLRRARRSYAGTLAPAPPAEQAPRFEGTGLTQIDLDPAVPTNVQ